MNAGMFCFIIFVLGVLFSNSRASVWLVDRVAGIVLQFVVWFVEWRRRHS